MTHTQHTTKTQSGDRYLKRSLGLWQLTALGVSTQIGSGWLFAVLGASAVAGPGAVVSWVVGAIAIGIVSLSWIELGTMLPRAGGIVRFPSMTHGSLVTWLNGWSYWIAHVCLPTIEAQATLTYLGGAFPALHLVESREGVTVLTWPLGILLGIAILVFFFCLNLFGVSLLARVNSFITVWKVVIPTITFILLFLAFKGSNFMAFESTASSSGGHFFYNGVEGMLHALAAGGVAFAFIGSRQALDYAGEAKNPARDIPRAIMLSIIIPLIIYIGLQVGFLGALDWESAGVTPGDWNALLGSSWAASPIFSALGAAGFAAFAVVLLIDAAISPAGNGWVTMGSACRVLFALSVDGYAPKTISKVNKFGIPWVSLVIAVIMSSLFMAPFPSWYRLVSIISICLTLSYLLGAPMVPVLRRTLPQLKRPFVLKHDWLWGPIGFVLGLFIVYAAGFSSLVQFLPIVFGGLVVFGGYTVVAHGWAKSPPAAWVISAIFLVTWVWITIKGGWMMNAGNEPFPGSWSFPVYLVAMIADLVFFVVAMIVVCKGEGRRSMNRGWWFIALLVLVLVIAYYGGFGPLEDPPLGGLLDLLALTILGIVGYYVAVAAGYQTPDLDNLVATLERGADGTYTLPGVPEEHPAQRAEQPGAEGSDEHSEE